MSYIYFHGVSEDMPSQDNQHQPTGINTPTSVNHVVDYSPVDEKQESLLFARIFEAPRFVRTRRRWTLTQSDFEVYGIIITGDMQMDEASMDDFVDTTRPISTLAEWHADGKEFIIPSMESQSAIYEDILNYTHYVAKRFNRLAIQSLHFDPENDDNLREVLNDVVKLQNLANRIFPHIVEHVKVDTPTKGLLGFLARRKSAEYGYVRGPILDFNPFEHYGFTMEQIQDPNMYSREEGTFNAVDIRRNFDPYTLSKLHKVV